MLRFLRHSSFAIAAMATSGFIVLPSVGLSQTGAGNPVGGTPGAGNPVGGTPGAGNPVGGTPGAGNPVGGIPGAGGGANTGGTISTGQGAGARGSAAPRQGQTSTNAPFGQRSANPGTAANQHPGGTSANASRANANTNSNNAEADNNGGTSQDRVKDAILDSQATKGSDRARTRTSNRVGTAGAAANGGSRANAGTARTNTRPGLADDRVVSPNKAAGRSTTAASAQNATGAQAAVSAQNRIAAPQGNTGPNSQAGASVTGTANGQAAAALSTNGIAQDGLLRNSLNQLGFQIGTAEGGLSISNINQSGLAAAAGFQQGDVITSLNGQQISGTNELSSLLGMAQPGDTLTFDVLRNGSAQQLTMTVPQKFQNGIGPDGQPIARAFDGGSGAEISAADIQTFRDEIQALRAEIEALRNR